MDTKPEKKLKRRIGRPSRGVKLEKKCKIEQKCVFRPIAAKASIVTKTEKIILSTDTAPFIPVFLNQQNQQILPIFGSQKNNLSQVTTEDRKEEKTNHNTIENPKEEARVKKKDKSSHNAEEKLRKARINNWINKLGEILGKCPGEKQSKSSILQKAYIYVETHENRGCVVKNEVEALLTRIKSLEEVLKLLLGLLTKYSITVPESIIEKSSYLKNLMFLDTCMINQLVGTANIKRKCNFFNLGKVNKDAISETSFCINTKSLEPTVTFSTSKTALSALSSQASVTSVSMITTSLPTSFITQGTSSSDKSLQVASPVNPCSQAAVPIPKVTQAKLPNASVAQAVLTKPAVIQAVSPTISIANSSSARICSPVASSTSPLLSTLSILPVSLPNVSLTEVSPPIASLPNINHTVASLPIPGNALSCVPKVTTCLSSSVASVPSSPVGSEEVDFQTFPNNTSLAYTNTGNKKQYPINLILPCSIETMSSGPILLNQSTPLTKVVFVTNILPAPVLKDDKLSTNNNQQVGSNSLKEITGTEKCATTCLQSLENENKNHVKLKKSEKQVKLLPLHIENSSKFNSNVYPKTIGKSPTEQKFGIDSLISNTEVDSFLNDLSTTNITNSNDNLEVVSTLLPVSPPPLPPSSSFTSLPSISNLGTLPSPLSLSASLSCSVTTGLVPQNSLGSVESVSSTSLLSLPTALSPLLPSSESLSNSFLVTSNTVSETLSVPVTFPLHLSSPLPTPVLSVTYSSVTVTTVVSSTPVQSVLSPSSSLITPTLLSLSVSSSSKSIISSSSTILTSSSSSSSSSSLSTPVPQTRSGTTLNSDNRSAPILSSSLLTHQENKPLKKAQTVEFSSTNRFIKNGAEGSCLMMSTNFDFLSKTSDGKKLSSQKLQLKHSSSDRDTHLITKTHSVTSMLAKEMNKNGFQKKNIIKKGQLKVLKQNFKNVPYKDCKERSVRLKKLHKSDHKSEITKRWGSVVKSIQNDQDNNMMFKSFVIGNSTSGNNTQLQMNKKNCIRKNNKHAKKKITSAENDLQSNTKTNESHETQPIYDKLTTHQVNTTVSSSSNSLINPGINVLDPKSQSDQNLNMASIMDKPKEVNALNNSQLFLSNTNSSQASNNVAKSTATVEGSGKQKSTVLTDSTSFSTNTSNKNPVQVVSNSSSSLQVKLTQSSSGSSKQQAIVASESTICMTQKTSTSSQNLTFIPTMKERTIRNKWLAAEKALSNSTFNTTDILANHGKNTSRYINLQQRKRGHGISLASHLSKFSKLNLSERTKKMKASKSFSAEALCKPAANQLALQKQWNFNKLGEPVNSGNKMQKSQIKSQNQLQLTSNKLATPSSQPHQLLTNKPHQNHQHKLKHPLDVTNTNPLPTILNIFAPAPIPQGVSENQSNLNQAPNNNFSNENQMSNPCDMDMMGENIGGSNFPDNIMMNGNQSLFTNFSTDSLLNEPSVPYAVDNIIAQSNTGPLSNCWNPWLPQDINFNEHMFTNNNGAPQRNRLVSNTECSPIKSIMSILEAQPNQNFQQFQQNLTMNTMQGSPMVEQRSEPRRAFNNQVRMNNQQTAQQVNFQNNLRFMPPIQHPSSWNLHELHKPYLQQSNVSNANNVFSASVNNINNNLHSQHNKQNVKQRAGPALGNYSLINSA